MTEPASDDLISNIEKLSTIDPGRKLELCYSLDLISRIRKEQEDKAVMARALEPFADKIAAFEKGYQEYGHDFSVVPDGLETGVSIGDLRRARAALTGSSTIISDMEAEIERLTSELKEARAKLFPYADATEISGYSSDGIYLIGDKESIKKARTAFHRAGQIDQYRDAFDEKIEAKEAEIERLKAEVRELERVLERGANAILYRELSK